MSSLSSSSRCAAFYGLDKLRVDDFGYWHEKGVICTRNLPTHIREDLSSTMIVKMEICKGADSGIFARHHWVLWLYSATNRVYWLEMHENGVALRGPVKSHLNPHEARYRGEVIVEAQDCQLRPGLSLYHLVDFIVPEYWCYYYNCRDFVYDVMYHALNAQHTLIRSGHKFFMKYWAYTVLTIVPSELVPHTIWPVPYTTKQYAKTHAIPRWIVYRDQDPVNISIDTLQRHIDDDIPLPLTWNTNKYDIHTI